MERVIKTAVHNRFDFEVTDSITGEVKQKVTSYNIILDNFFDKLINCNPFKLYYIYLGTGTGTPAVTDTQMFDSLCYKTAETVETVKDYPTSYIKKKIVLLPSECVSETITEVGFGCSSASDGYLVTHSMLKDSEGNQISILKTSTDVLTVYATFYVTIGNSDNYVLPTPENNDIIKAVLEDNASSFYLNTGMSNLIETADELKTTMYQPRSAISSGKQIYFSSANKDVLNSRWNFPTTRWNYNEDNNHMINAIGSPTIAAWTLPNTDIFPNLTLSDITVGEGDGETTEFKLPVPIIVENSESIRVDGVLKTKGTDYTIDYNNNAVEWPEFFVSSDPKKVTAIEYAGKLNADSYIQSLLIWDKTSTQCIYFNCSTPAVFDFYEPVEINRLIICQGSITSIYGTLGIDYSDDGENWTNAYTSEEISNTIANDVKEWFEPAIVARFWRITSDDLNSCRAKLFPNILLGRVTPGLVFTNPPASGAAIEMDCQIDRPLKNENWVIDFGFSVQFERG